MIKTHPQILDTGDRFKSKLAVDDDGWNRHGASQLFGQFGMPNGALEFFCDNDLPPD